MENTADLTRRLLELERRMDRDDKLGAIALVHDRTGMGLVEARRTVEQMMGGS